VLVPIWTPFLKTLYPVTPTLSVEAAHARLTLEDVTLEAETPVGTDGGVVSTAPVVVAKSVPDSPELLPAESTAEML
jgi:hypothetical protein